jgi:hypothetical protein
MKIISIPLSRWRMFYIILNVYIFNWLINVYFWQLGFQKGEYLNTNRTHPLYNLPERAQILGHMHIICITVVHNRIICCQIFCDLLINSAAVKSRHLFLCWYVLLIYFVMMRLIMIYLSYLNIDKLLQIKFVNSQWFLEQVENVNIKHYKFKSWVTRISFALLLWTTESSAV